MMKLQTSHSPRTTIVGLGCAVLFLLATTTTGWTQIADEPTAPMTIPPPVAIDPVSPPSVAPMDIDPPVPIPPPGSITPAPISPTEVMPPGAPGTGLDITTSPDGTSLSDIPLATTEDMNPSGPRAREFQGDELGQVLRLLARQAKINVVISDQVVGTVTMRLEDVTAMQAINIIATSKGLVIEVLDNVYYIKTQAEKAAEPTQSLSYTFNFARAENVAPLLAGQLQAQGAPPQVDVRTNTVFYREARSNIANIQEFLAKVDRPTKQVMIEARLIETTSNPTQDYGINWSGVFSDKTINYGGSGVTQTTTNGVTTNTATFPPSGNFFRNANSFASLGNALGSQFAILSVPSLSVTLNLLNADADAEFLGHPRIVTADNLEATIKIVRDRPVPSLNFNEQTATAVFGGFDNYIFGTTLIVKPSINKDNWVTLSVRPEISNSPEDVTFDLNGAVVSAPVIDTRSLESNVLIKSGDTLAIGGLLQDQVSQVRTKVPVLGDIPGLGYLFSSRSSERSKRNLLIFITPTVISSNTGTGLEGQAGGLLPVGQSYADPAGWINNARGALEVIPTENYSVADDYPLPGQVARPQGLRMKGAPRARE